jgi:hypothetical protein
MMHIKIIAYNESLVAKAEELFQEQLRALNRE